MAEARSVFERNSIILLIEMTIRYIFFFTLLLMPLPLLASEGNIDNDNIDNSEAAFASYWGRLQSHEANELGYTLDEDDKPFFDFKISLKYPIFHENKPTPPVFMAIPNPYLYFAFTGRFGQYIGTRDSSPVISKRFNPEIFVRGWLNIDPLNEEYIDFPIVGHESNGQSIDTPNEYYDKRNTFETSGEDPNFADDYISRGWDYVGASWRKTLVSKSKKESISGQLSFRYFMEDGPLQKSAEEYNSWENNPEGKPRGYVDGIRVKVEGDFLILTNKVFPKFKTENIPLITGIFEFNFATGYSRMFEYNTVGLEVGVEFFGLPGVFWYSNGYNSDLAQYYKNVDSWGFKLKLY